MGRYSSWWSRLLIIGIIVAVITPVGIYAVPKLEPYLNLLPFYEDPSNTEVRNMVFISSDADTNGKWTWCVNRLDIAFMNPLDKHLQIPKSDVSVKYFGGILGNGYIGEEYSIGPYETTIVSMYLKTYNVGKQGELFSKFLKALFWGQELTLNVDINAYILIDGVLGEPLLGLKFPMTIKNPLPFGLTGWAPLIYNIISGAPSHNTPVTITVKASDPGTGISNRAYIYYKFGEDETWDKSDPDGRIQLQGPAWATTFKGLKIGGEFPIASSYWDAPVLFTGNIPGQPAETEVAYYIYLEDYAGNWEHVKQANYVESEVLSYTVGKDSNNKTYEVTWEDPFIIRYLEYLDNHGTHIQNFLYTLGITLLQFTPLLAEFSQVLYALDVDMGYFLALLMGDFIKGLRFMADSGVPPGKLMNILGLQFGFNFNDMVEYILPRIWFPFEGDDNVNQLADDVFIMVGSQKEALEAKFDATGINAAAFQQYISPTGLFGSGNEEFRNFYAIEIELFGVTIRVQGAIITDWTYNTGRTPYQNWLDLIRTDDGTNGHWAAANLLLKSSYATNPPRTSQALFAELLNTKLKEIPEAFPANDLYPYTHQLVSLVMLLALGVVSYLVLKREILIHRKVERGIAKKKKMEQKTVFDKDAKNKAQSKYL